jgi:hypothetical protein
MKNQKENIIHSLGTAIVIVFFLLLISSLSGKSIGQTSSTSQYELSSGYHIKQLKAVSADVFQLSFLKKSFLPVLCNFNNTNYKILADNRKVKQCFEILHKTFLFENPVIIHRYCYGIFYENAEDIPILS